MRAHQALQIRHSVIRHSARCHRRYRRRAAALSSRSRATAAAEPPGATRGGPPNPRRSLRLPPHHPRPARRKHRAELRRPRQLPSPRKCLRSPGFLRARPGPTGTSRGDLRVERAESRSGLGSWTSLHGRWPEARPHQESHEPVGQTRGRHRRTRGQLPVRTLVRTSCQRRRTVAAGQMTGHITGRATRRRAAASDGAARCQIMARRQPRHHHLCKMMTTVPSPGPDGAGSSRLGRRPRGRGSHLLLLNRRPRVAQLQRARQRAAARPQRIGAGARPPVMVQTAAARATAALRGAVSGPQPTPPGNPPQASGAPPTGMGRRPAGARQLLGIRRRRIGRPRRHLGGANGGD